MNASPSAAREAAPTALTAPEAALPASARRVAEALDAAGVQARVVETAASGRTAEEAASALGCGVAQIVKPLVFRGAESGRPWLILVSGANRVHERRLGRALGEPLARADADFVRAATGFAIGGVAPVGHPAPLAAAMDEDLLAYETVWAAAGSPRHVFPVESETLKRLTGARALKVT